MSLSFSPDQVASWPIGRLLPYARNARIHDDGQVAKIAGSIAEFGWTVPVLVTGSGEIIAGHGRVLAARKLGLEAVPVIVLDHLTPAQRQAYRIADNRLTELGGWDEALLAGELKELVAEDFDLSLVGFEDGELDRGHGHPERGALQLVIALMDVGFLHHRFQIACILTDEEILQAVHLHRPDRQHWRIVCGRKTNGAIL